MPDAYEQLRQELGQTGPEQTLAQNIDAVGKLFRHKDRSFIVKGIVIIYGLALLICFAYAFYHGVLSGGQTAPADPFEIVKVAILPVLTLVIGYYFGTTRSGSD